MSRRVFLFVLITLTSAFAAEPPSPATYGVRMEQTWIPMKDGVRLAATLYMPDGAKAGDKFPAVLEYLPYRKDDGTAAGDYGKHAYFARRGFVGVRVDIRGFGASEGTPSEREYSETEQVDGEQIIAWLAKQPWCNGNVGMFGISWGGFNSLQMAMRHPPALKAIIAIAATSELFHDDVHYMDGMAHVDEFELNMDMAQGWAAAPDYALNDVVLNQRFETPPWSLLYFKHQHDGPFWRDRVRPYRDVEAPLFLSADFRTDTATAFRTCWSKLRRRPSRPCSAHGTTACRMSPTSGRASSGATRPFVGGTTGSKAATPACCRTRSSSSSCRAGARWTQISTQFPASGGVRMLGPRGTRSQPLSTRSLTIRWRNRPPREKSISSSTFLPSGWKPASGGVNYLVMCARWMRLVWFTTLRRSRKKSPSSANRTPY